MSESDSVAVVAEGGEKPGELEPVADPDGASMMERTDMETDPTDLEGLDSRGETPADFDGDDEDDWLTDLELEEEKEVEDTTGAKAYQTRCQELGLVPISRLIKELEEERTEVSLAHYGAGQNGAVALASFITLNPFVTSLDLSDNYLQGPGGEAVALALQQNNAISEINLSGNRLGSDGGHAMAAVLAERDSLKKLNLQGNRLGEKEMVAIAEALGNNGSLLQLNLSRNDFSEKGGFALGQALSVNGTLVELDLSWNSIRLKGALGVAEGLKANTTITILNLSWNGLGEEGGAALGQALKENSTIEQLDIRHNRIGPAAGASIADALVENSTLQYLKMDFNNIGPTATKFVNCLMENSSLKGFGYYHTIEITDDVVELQRIMQEKDMIILEPSLELGEQLSGKVAKGAYFSVAPTGVPAEPAEAAGAAEGEGEEQEETGEEEE